MGCKPSKDLKSNLTADEQGSDVGGVWRSHQSDEPTQVIGSTIMHADQIVALGNSAFVLIRNAKTGEDAIMEIHVGEKKLVYMAEWRIKLLDLVLLR